MKQLSLIAIACSCAFVLANRGAAFADDAEIHTFYHFPEPNAATAPWKVHDLCQAYNFPTGKPGGGVIGILELGGGWSQEDLDLFSTLNGLPTISVTDVSVSGGQNNYGVSNADFEVALDIEVAAAAYYYCTGTMPTIKVFFAPNSSQAFIDVINAAVTNNCDVLSISWGGPEKTWGNSFLQQLDGVAQTAGTNGLTIFAASGDNSSSDGTFGRNVDAPACCPHVVGCGGTRKTAVEVVWGNGNPRGSGTGGGFSSVFRTQSFQIGVPPSDRRMVPDVAANADPATGYKIVVRGSETTIGGTSAVSPLYSGLFPALGHQLGFVTPTLWLNQSAFTDITVGSNGAYKALPGPDPCSGLGAPKGTSLAALFGGPSAAFQVAVLGATSGASQGALDVKQPASSLFSVVSGSGPSAVGGHFAAIVLNPPAASPLLFGIGGGLGANGLDLFTFAGRK